MVFIRDKKVKGHSYAYIVKNAWDNKNGKVKQEIIKYLGRSSKVTLDDIPKEFQKDPNVVTFIACHSSNTEKMELDMKKKMSELLINSDINTLVEVFERYSKIFGIVKFYERLLAPVMYKIGELWKEGKLDVATEHICSNAAHTLVKIINEKASRKSFENKKASATKILLCTPEGEYHSLGCMVIESFLKIKGYTVFNIAPSVPSQSIITFVADYRPDLIMISITLPENFSAANRLVNKLLNSNSKKDSPYILVGGIGLEAITIKEQEQNNTTKNVKFLKGVKLSGIIPSIREVIKKDGLKLNGTIKK